MTITQRKFNIERMPDDFGGTVQESAVLHWFVCIRGTLLWLTSVHDTISENCSEINYPFRSAKDIIRVLPLFVVELDFTSVDEIWVWQGSVPTRFQWRLVRRSLQVLTSQCKACSALLSVPYNLLRAYYVWAQHQAITIVSGLQCVELVTSSYLYASGLAAFRRMGRYLYFVFRVESSKFHHI
jgi:hypothetical protein